MKAFEARERDSHDFSRRLTSLLSAINELSKAEHMDDLCRGAVEYAIRHIGFDRAGIWFFADNRRSIVGSFGTDVNGRLQDERNLRLPTDDRPVKAMLESREPVVF